MVIISPKTGLPTHSLRTWRCVSLACLVEAARGRNQYASSVSLALDPDLTTFANIRVQEASAAAARATEQSARLSARDAIHRYWNTVRADITPTSPMHAPSCNSQPGATHTRMRDEPTGRCVLFSGPAPKPLICLSA